MAWYKVKLSDGSDHRLWFGHDPTEADVLASLKAPTMAEGAPLADQPDQPEVGVGGSPLQRAMGTEADPNSPEKLLKGAMFAGSFPGGPAGTAAGGVAQTALGRASQIASKPSVIGGLTGAAAGAIESGGRLKPTLLGAAAGAGLPVVGHGLAKYAGKAIDAALSARVAHVLAREAPEAVAAAAEPLETLAAGLVKAKMFKTPDDALKLLRSLKHPDQVAAIAKQAGLEAPMMAPGASQAAKALEVAGLSPELATAEAGKMASATGEVSANLPGVMTPARGTPKVSAVAVGEQIQAQVQTLRASGLSKPQIIQTLRETYGHDNLPADTAEKMVDMISGSSSRVAATAEALPAGSRVMPSYRGGPAKPSAGPARVPTSDADLSQLLKDSIAAYKLP